MNPLQRTIITGAVGAALGISASLWHDVAVATGGAVREWVKKKKKPKEAIVLPIALTAGFSYAENARGVALTLGSADSPPLFVLGGSRRARGHLRPLDIPPPSHVDIGGIISLDENGVLVRGERVIPGPDAFRLFLRWLRTAGYGDWSGGTGITIGTSSVKFGHHMTLNGRSATLHRATLPSWINEYETDSPRLIGLAFIDWLHDETGVGEQQKEDNSMSGCGCGWRS